MEERGLLWAATATAVAFGALLSLTAHGLIFPGLAIYVSTWIIDALAFGCFAFAVGTFLATTQASPRYRFLCGAIALTAFTLGAAGVALDPGGHHTVTSFGIVIPEIVSRLLCGATACCLALGSGLTWYRVIRPPGDAA